MINVLTQFAAEGAGAEATGLAALGIDARAFAIQLVTFLFVFLILRKFVFKPVVRLLNNRQETIEQGVKLTTQLSAQKEELDKEVAEARKKARKEAEEILAASHAEATAMIKEAEENAQAKAKAVLEEAQQKIADEAAKARRDLESEMVDLVISATEKVTGEKLDAKKDNALINSALKGQA